MDAAEGLAFRDRPRLRARSDSAERAQVKRPLAEKSRP